MDRIQDGRSDLLSLVQMPQIGAGKILAGIAATAFVDRLLVLGVFLVLDDDLPAGREKSSGPGISGGEDAVKKVNPLFNGNENVLDISYTHEIAGLFLGEERISSFQRLE